jgi:hypothetical protein
MLVGLFLSPAQREINRPFPNNSSLRKEEEKNGSVFQCGSAELVGTVLLSSEFRVS